MGAAISDIFARTIIDSRGNPTVEVDCYVDGVLKGRAAVPSGASTGTHEAVELRDGATQWMGKGVGVTERTVRTRIKRLEDEGVIRGYTVRESGIGLTALIRLKVGSGTEIGSLAGEFSGWAGVECVYEISGDADLVAVVHVDDTVALRDMLDRMWLAAPGDISSTQTELVLEQY